LSLVWGRVSRFQLFNIRQRLGSSSAGLFDGGNLVLGGVQENYCKVVIGFMFGRRLDLDFRLG
jgi:hypothetical protein